jgi:hypothetical protein
MHRRKSELQRSWPISRHTSWLDTYQALAEQPANQKASPTQDYGSDSLPPEQQPISTHQPPQHGETVRAEQDDYSQNRIAKTISSRAVIRPA